MRGSFGRASLLLLVASAAVTISMHACKEPTQVTVDIRTLGFKCQELKKITVVVAADPTAAEGKWQYPQAEVGECQGEHEVGTLVVTPSGDHGAVMVLASYSESPCVAPDYLNCIVARRQFSFIENVPLRLPITLEASCKNVPCNALSSCRSGACVSSEADCNDTGTCAAPSEPVVADDGGVIPPPGDATIDIPPNDAFVPPDAPPDVKPQSDGSATDAPFDAPKNDSSNPGDGGFGNACPSMPSGPNCNSFTLTCCAQLNFSCRPLGGSPDASCSAGPFYPCTGRAGCADPSTQYCCAPLTPATMGMSSACSTFCGAGAEVLCTTDNDCPGQAKCTGIYTSLGNGALSYCK